MRNESLETAIHNLLVFQFILIVFDITVQESKYLHLERQPGDKCPWKNIPNKR